MKAIFNELHWFSARNSIKGCSLCVPSRQQNDSIYKELLEEIRATVNNFFLTGYSEFTIS